LAKLYADENFPQPAVDALREYGHDVLTVLESGKTGVALSDEDVLTHAANEGRIVVTMNRKHFIRLHLNSSTHAGIMVCTVDPDYHALASRIHAALEVTPQMTGQLIRIYRPA
jgi:hypothetical protein